MNRKSADPRATARPRLTDRAPRTRAAVAAAGLLVICAAPLAGAATGDNLREGVRNGTTTSETQIISNLATTNRPTGGYSMRMSNLSSTGGGFINGCRASAAATSKPCYRANNLSDGRAFEFNSSDGAVVGTITVGTAGDDKKPFTTNATGVALGLNADRLDSLHASEIIAAARTKAGLDADTLDGQDSAAIIAAARTKTGLDADTLDGLDSTQFAGAPTVVRTTVSVAGGTDNGINTFAICPAGTRALGGGVGAANGGAADDRVIFSGPTDSTGNFTNTVSGDVPVRWAGRYLNASGAAIDVYVWAICG